MKLSEKYLQHTTIVIKCVFFNKGDFLDKFLESTEKLLGLNMKFYLLALGFLALAQVELKNNKRFY